MRGLIALVASAAINASTIPAVAADRMPNRDIDALRTHWATLRNQPASAADKEKTCRAYAASFYQSVTLRQVAASRGGGERYLALLDFTINAFNDLLATKCSS
jgi:hypothetical protein